jgi:transposase
MINSSETTEVIGMRARRLKLHPKTAKKLLGIKKEAERDGQYRVAKRIHATLLNDDGKTSGEIAEILKAPRSKVSQWLSNYEEHGHESFLEGHRTGRPCKLTPVEKKELGDIVESGPVAYGFLSGVWTAVMVGRVIQNEFGIEYDARHVRRILDELDFSLQRPKRLLAKADPEKQARWIRYTYPQIKKKPDHPMPV